jgi:hypothetical protein
MRRASREHLSGSALLLMRVCTEGGTPREESVVGRPGSAHVCAIARRRATEG